MILLGQCKEKNLYEIFFVLSVSFAYTSLRMVSFFSHRHTNRWFRVCIYIAGEMCVDKRKRCPVFTKFVLSGSWFWGYIINIIIITLLSSSSARHQILVRTYISTEGKEYSICTQCVYIFNSLVRVWYYMLLKSCFGIH